MKSNNEKRIIIKCTYTNPETYDKKYYNFCFTEGSSNDFILGFISSVITKYGLNVKNPFLAFYRGNSIYVLNDRDKNDVNRSEGKHILYDVNEDGYECGYTVNNINEFIKGYRSGQLIQIITGYDYNYTNNNLYLSKTKLSDVEYYEELFKEEDVVYKVFNMDELLKGKNLMGAVH